MVVEAVHPQSEFFLVFLNHALSTEKEKVMGLCIEEMNEDTNNNSKFTFARIKIHRAAEKVYIVHIHSVILL